MVQLTPPDGLGTRTTPMSVAEIPVTTERAFATSKVDEVSDSDTPDAELGPVSENEDNDRQQGVTEGVVVTLAV